MVEWWKVFSDKEVVVSFCWRSELCREKRHA